VTCRRGGFRVDWKFSTPAAKAAIHFAGLTARLEAASFQSKAERRSGEAQSKAEKRKHGGEAER
jgi:hypothetical protein